MIVDYEYKKKITSTDMQYNVRIFVIIICMIKHALDYYDGDGDADGDGHLR